MYKEAAANGMLLNAYDTSADTAIAVLEADGWIYDANGEPYVEGVRYKKIPGAVATENDINYKSKDGAYVTTKVGDRYVLEEMLAGGYNIGGEQSGHIIFLDEATTGDGELSGIKLLEILKKSGKKMSEVASLMETFPQVLYNVTIQPQKKGLWQDDADIAAMIEKYTAILGENGRILVRESGTEPLIRVMVEGKDAAQIETAAQAITEQVKIFAAS